MLNQCVQLSHEITQINRFLSLHFSEVENYELHTLLTSINRESEFIQSNRELIQAITSTSISTFKTIKEVVNWDELDAVIAYGQLMQFKNPNYFIIQELVYTTI